MDVLDVVQYSIITLGVISIGYLTYKLNILSNFDGNEIRDTINNNIDNITKNQENTELNINIIKETGEKINESIPKVMSHYASIPERAQNNLNKLGNLTKDTLEKVTNNITNNIEETKENIHNIKECLTKVIVNQDIHTEINILAGLILIYGIICLIKWKY